MTAEERFIKNIVKTDSCWLWTANKIKKGYGRFKVNNKHTLAHRYSYSLKYGEFDSKMDVLHKCDNPSCVNPEHLFLGTHDENMKDMALKKRAKPPNGNNHHAIKITEEMVPEIIKLLSEGIPQREIGRRYGVSQNPIQRINLKKRHSLKSAFSRK